MAHFGLVYDALLDSLDYYAPTSNYVLRSVADRTYRSTNLTEDISALRDCEAKL
jgi:hypothetical protein